MADPAPDGSPSAGALVRRHRLPVRLWHWVNAVTLAVMLMSGLMIFNAHPRLYWGEYGANADPAWLEIGANPQGRGLVRIGDFAVETTGVLGIWTDGEGVRQETAFPGWATLPSRYDLAGARVWHFAFAWVLALGLLGFLLWGLLGGHLRRDLQALRYGVLQKLAYCFVLFVALPMAILTGLALSPGMDAAWPWLTALWGGRQSARSVHFIAAFALLGFFLVHIAMVLLSGPVNQLRAMVTGWYRLPEERG